MKQEKQRAGISAIIVIILTALILSGGSAYFLIKNKAKNIRVSEPEISAVTEKPDAKNQAVPPTSTPPAVPPEAETNDAKPEIEGIVLAGTEAKLVDFNKEDYERALRGDKLVVLYFYAEWCPICQAELPNLYSAFNELQTRNVIGFRVNFNDDYTDPDEKALTQEFGVAYQHTKVFILKGRRVLKDPDPWQKDKYLQEIAKFAP